uniref:RING-type domain-containing protein n=1 Tax=Timema tahoe TaxID=61484 RepID=A0A7R9NYC3_9NEOP|nr:unnamed protein product [Timema tahoe]
MLTHTICCQANTSPPQFHRVLSSWFSTRESGVYQRVSVRVYGAGTSGGVPASGTLSLLFGQLENICCRDVLSDCISEVRKRNNNTLTGLFMPFIINQVEQELTKRKEGTGAMGLEKFGNSAWRTQPDNTVKWDKPQDKDTPEEDCIICMEPLGSDQQSSLHCNHTFHTQCIKPWLRTQSVCPMCRVFTRMVDEFPPLA